MEKNKIKRSEILLEQIMQSDVISIKGNIKKYSKILTALDILSHFVANTYAKQILEASSQSGQEFYPSREKFPSVVPNQPQKEITKKQVTKRQTKKRSVKGIGPSSPKVKRSDQLYLNGAASYGSTKRLHAQSKLSLGKVQSYLVTNRLSQSTVQFD